ncbi:MAG TPA: Sua5/YciO/YrdC/YwlC family protein [Solirubrobacteraceae bacterium]|nr:Sua5/YciO/YrdC/YwlC family protein [Solirubrobacteraceae bacterium]
MPLRIDLAAPRVDLAPLVASLAAGACAVIPTDTVYGLVCDAAQPAATARLSALKGRDPSQPSTVMFAGGGAESLLDPLDPVLATQARALIGRGATVLLPNPEGRFLHLCGDTPGRIGVRVSAFPPALADAIAEIGAIVATSANLHGAADPCTLDEVPPALAGACAVLVDGGPAAGGRASTVLDLCAPRPVILREGALATVDALALIA